MRISPVEPGVRHKFDFRWSHSIYIESENDGQDDAMEGEQWKWGRWRGDGWRRGNNSNDDDDDDNDEMTTTWLSTIGKCRRLQWDGEEDDYGGEGRMETVAGQRFNNQIERLRAVGGSMNDWWRLRQPWQLMMTTTTTKMRTTHWWWRQWQRRRQWWPTKTMTTMTTTTTTTTTTKMTTTTTPQQRRWQRVWRWQSAWSGLRRVLPGVRKCTPGLVLDQLEAGASRALSGTRRFDDGFAVCRSTIAPWQLIMNEQSSFLDQNAQQKDASGLPVHLLGSGRRSWFPQGTHDSANGSSPSLSGAFAHHQKAPSRRPDLPINQMWDARWIGKMESRQDESLHLQSWQKTEQVQQTQMRQQLKTSCKHEELWMVQ